ncbi:unnamed protein product [Prunus brigantina]
MASSFLKIESLLGLLTIRLADDNFLKWSYQIESVLQGYELFGHFDGSSVPPPQFAIVDEEGDTSELTTAYKEWIRTDKALLSLLIASLSDEALEYVIGCKTARDAWINLSDRYASVSRARINHLKTELQTAQKGGDSIERFLLRLKHLRDQLNAAGIKISDDDFIINALNGLPPEYDIIKTVLIARDTPLSLKDFRAQLLAAEQTAEARIVHHTALYATNSSCAQGSSVSSGQGILRTPSQPLPHVQSFGGQQSSFSRASGSRGFSAQTSGRGRFNGGRHVSSQFRGGSTSGFPGGSNSYRSHVVPECQICSKRGHTAANCYYRHANSSYSTSSVVECQICGKRGHGALDCFHRSNYSFQGQAPPSSLNAMTAQTSFSPEHVWIADSGASHHMVGNSSQLDHVTPCNVDENVTVGNGAGLTIQNLGTATISCAQSNSLHLPSVLHVPKLKANLLSVHQLCKDNNCFITFDVSGFYIQDKIIKAILLQGKSNQGLYLIPLSASQRSRGVSSISSTPVAYLGQHVNVSIWHQRLGHPTNTVVQRMLQDSALSVSVDTSQALCTACLHGKMHKLSFPKDHIKSNVPFQRIHSDVWGPSRHKSIDGFRYYVSFIDECTGYLWLYPLFNKSGVFEEFLKFYALVTNQFKAIIQYFQSDGGERKNRHIIETALTLLVASALPDKFWFHSVAHAAYLINLMPSSVLRYQSPFQSLYGKVPDIKSLRIFGTAVYPYIRPYNEHKLQPRTAQCVFMGYSPGYKGVICYNRSTSRFVVSRHVIHDETVFPFKSQSISADSVPISCSSQTQPLPICVSLPPCIHALNPSDISGSISPQHVSSQNHSSQNVSISSLESTENPALSSSDSVLSAINDQQLQVLLPASPSVSSSMYPPVNTHAMQTRSKAGIVKSKQFEDYQCYYTTLPVIHDATEPATYKVASQSVHWTQAMKDEIEALHAQGTWELVPKPVHKNIVGCRWVYRIKKNSDGTLARYKARLVAQGFSQAPGLDFSETFSPVVRHTTVRLILSIAAMNRWSLRQLDVKNAFLHGDLEEEVYMCQPQGFEDPKHLSYVCKLRKSLYGLKQAPRAWNAKFTGYLPAIGFESSHSDPSLFVKHLGSDIVILLLYVDDIILTGSKVALVQEVVDELSSVFDMKDMGKLKYFLGLQISYNTAGDIFVNQAKYAKDLLAKAGLSSCRPCPTPCKPHGQLLKTEGDALTDPTIYRSIVGALQYLTFTRPEISYAVNTVCQFMTTPSELHFQLVKRILRYLQGTLDHGLTFTSGAWELNAYSDADGQRI